MPSTPTVSPASHGSAYTSPDGSRWSWDGNEWQLSLTETVRFRWWRSGVALVGGAVGLAALIGGGILAATQDPNRDLTRGEQMVIRATLQTAGIAQSIHRTETLAYTGSLDDLIGSGFAPVPHVFVTVVSATDGTYCLAAGRVGARPIAWLTQDGESPTACG